MFAMIMAALQAYVLSVKAATQLAELNYKITKIKWENDLSAVTNRLESGEVLTSEERKAMAKKLGSLTAGL
jgi:hypothetical protein